MVDRFALSSVITASKSTFHNEINTKSDSEEISSSGGTSNLHVHSRRCAKASSIDISPYKSTAFTQKLIKWITMAGLPLDTLENRHFREALTILEPNVQVIGRTQTTRYISKIYDCLVLEAKDCIRVRHRTHTILTDRACRMFKA